MSKKQPRSSLPRFVGLAQLRAWLRDTEEGQSIVAELARPELHPLEWLYSTPEGQKAQVELAERLGRAKLRVIVLIAADGHVEVFGDPYIDVRVAYGPGWSQTAASDEDAAAEYLAKLDDLVAAIPLYYREVITGSRRLATGQVNVSLKHGAEVMRVDDAAQVVDDLVAHAVTIENKVRDQHLAEQRHPARGRCPKCHGQYFLIGHGCLTIVCGSCYYVCADNDGRLIPEWTPGYEAQPTEAEDATEDETQTEETHE